MKEPIYQLIKMKESKSIYQLIKACSRINCKDKEKALKELRQIQMKPALRKKVGYNPAGEFLYSIFTWSNAPSEWLFWNKINVQLYYQK